MFGHDFSVQNTSIRAYGRILHQSLRNISCFCRSFLAWPSSPAHEVLPTTPAIQPSSFQKFAHLGTLQTSKALAMSLAKHAPHLTNTRRSVIHHLICTQPRQSAVTPVRPRARNKASMQCKNVPLPSTYVLAKAVAAAGTACPITDPPLLQLESFHARHIATRAVSCLPCSNSLPLYSPHQT
jgi:hypothetical protein